MKKTIYLLATSLLIVLVACNNDDDQDNVEPDQGPTTVDLLGNATFPEGILTLSTDDILVGGFGDGSIQRIDGDENVSYFKNPGEDGLVIAVGMAEDVNRGRLWVANFNFDTGDGVPGSQMKVFDVNSGDLLATIPETFIPGVFFNEVAIDNSGNVYVSDTFNPQIWKAGNDLQEVEVFVENDLLSNPAPDQPFDLNGLAITPDNNYLIASVMDRLDAGDGRLVRISLTDSSVSGVQLSGTSAVSAFAGSDGMIFNDNQLIMVNVFSEAGAIITADFSADFGTAALTIRDRFQDSYNRPTASAVRNGRLWTVNSQLDHIIDDNNGALGTDADLPFEVLHVSLAQVFE